MQGVKVAHSPSLSVVLPFYLTGALFFTILAFSLLFSSDAFAGHYFHPKLLAMTHLAALGWGTMIIFGALFQLLPVITEVALFSEKLAKITYFLFTLGVICLALSFWFSMHGLPIQLGSVIIFTSFLFFLFNVLVTIRKTARLGLESLFIISASIWLLLTGTLGTLMAFNLSIPIFTKSHLLFLKIHAHLGIVGWFILLIMGVGSKLIPMFLLAHGLNRNKLKFAFWLTNIGLIGFSLDLYFSDSNTRIFIYAVMMIAGIFCFFTYIFEALNKRLRKALDIGLKHTILAFIMLVIPILISLIISLKMPTDNSLLLKANLIYGITIFLGFISSLILGQTYKTLPFIIWVHQYSKMGTAQESVMPKNMYYHLLAEIQLVLFVFSVPIILIGVLGSSQTVIFIGASCLFVTAVLYNINVVKIITHSQKIKKANGNK